MKEPRMHLSDHRDLGKRKADTGYVLINLIRYLKPWMAVFVLLFIANIASVVLSLTGPKLSGDAIDMIKPDGSTDMDAVYYCCALLAGIYAL